MGRLGCHTGTDRLPYTVCRETLESLRRYAGAASSDLQWPAVFVYPFWLETWWRHFQGRAEMLLLSVRQGEKVIGIAPFMVEDSRVSLIGSPEVCDYLDCIIVHGAADTFARALLDHLFSSGIHALDLRCLRADAALLAGIKAVAPELKLELSCVQEAVSMELELPSTWEQYLAGLNKKQRHEVRRKLRRLGEASTYRYYEIEDYKAWAEFLPVFMRMFKQNPEKAQFLSMQEGLFFREAVSDAARAGLARFGVLEVDGSTAAAVLYFDHHDVVYLYNSAYDPARAGLSTGLLCKVLSIKEAIANKKSRYDFLKGGEVYKQRLGGHAVPIYKCRITMQ